MNNSAEATCAVNVTLSSLSPSLTSMLDDPGFQEGEHAGRGGKGLNGSLRLRQKRKARSLRERYERPFERPSRVVGKLAGVL